jgi:hypothetical protein
LCCPTHDKFQIKGFGSELGVNNRNLVEKMTAEGFILQAVAGLAVSRNIVPSPQPAAGDYDLLRILLGGKPKSGKKWSRERLEACSW